MKILTWTISPALVQEMEEHYKSREAHSWSGDAESTIREFTFDGVAPELTNAKCEKFLHFVERTLLSHQLSGIGIEVGAGPGTWSAFIARARSVEKMYALDACGPIVALAPKVVQAILPGNEHKVIPVVGDFDHMELPDNSLDFAFDFFSLHHSTNLDRTFRELFRILKPGGIVLCFDKARADVLTDYDLGSMLDQEYSDEFKKKMGIPAGASHTRRMNGENEYRLRDWRAAFLGVGFSRFEHFNVARTVSSNRLIAITKTFFAKLPPRLQAIFTRLVIPASKRGVSISADHRIYSSLVADFPKEISVMIATK